ncbi:MAG: sulfatase [Myxococcota bacterium]|nr:sulfatase [Myxococcota bacterium]
MKHPPPHARFSWPGAVRALVIGSGLSAVALLSGCEAEPACRECNVILISLDTLRADRLGAYGYPRETSPQIDAFASESAVFLNTLAQHANTPASHQSLFTGLYVSEEDEAPRITELLGARGYRTAAFTGGGLLHRRFGFARGFDVYHDSVQRTGLAQVTPLAINWLRKNREHPFFLLLHTYDIHCPYTPPAPFLEMFTEHYRPGLRHLLGCRREASGRELSPESVELISAAYDGGVRWTDTLLGRFFDEIERLELDRKTIVVLVSDHGESLGEEGFFGHGWFKEETHKVPLIIHVPGSDPRITNEPAQLVDVLPTTLRLLGIEPPTGLDGVDLGPILRGEFSFEGHRPRLGLNPLGEVMFRVDDDFVLIDRLFSDDLLYDLNSEWRDVASEHPERVESLLAQLAEFRRTRPAGSRLTPDKPPDLDEVPAELREQLRALGYVD